MISDTQKVQLLIERYSINTSLKRIKALAPELSEEEAEKIARKKDGYDQLIMQKTLGKASLRLKYRVEDIVDKNEQIYKLEKSVE
jgi:syntaxin 1B/2/3